MICDNCKNKIICKYKEEVNLIAKEINLNTEYKIKDLPIYVTVNCKYNDLNGLFGQVWR